MPLVPHWVQYSIHGTCRGHGSSRACLLVSLHRPVPNPIRLFPLARPLTNVCCPAQTMRTFEVYLNKKRLCVAGIDAECVLATIINYVSIKRRRRLGLSVGGLDTSTGKHVRWQNRVLRLGDEVRVRIVERKLADIPSKRSPRDPKAELKSQKRYVRKMAKKLGWRIKEH